METEATKLWVSLCEDKQLMRNLRLIIKKYFRNSDDSDDVLQELLIKLKGVFEKKIPDMHNYEGYLYRVTINHCMDTYRKNNRIPKVSTNFHTDRIQLSEEQECFEERELLEWRAQQLTFAIENLPKLSAVVVYLRFEKKSYAEISKKIGCTEGAARSRFNKAKQSIKKKL